MRLIIYIFIICHLVIAKRKYETQHFINSHSLKIPKISKSMLDVNDFTHTSDSWEYFYQENTKKLDSVVEQLTIQGFPPSKTIEKYLYKTDTIFSEMISISLSNGDTLNNCRRKYTDNFRTKEVLDLKTKCIWRSKFDKRGIKLLDVRKCPDEKDFDGQLFHLKRKKEYLERYKEKNGNIDSNSIRRYYLTPFDSILADYMVKKDKDPFIVRLNIYNNSNKKQVSYGLGIYSNINEVLNINHYTYTKKGNLYRIYHLQVKKRDAKNKIFELVNYTEYEYDKLGRIKKTTTRVKPDPKYQKKEGKKK